MLKTMRRISTTAILIEHAERVPYASLARAPDREFFDRLRPEFFWNLLMLDLVTTKFDNNSDVLGVILPKTGINSYFPFAQ